MSSEQDAIKAWNEWSKRGGRPIVSLDSKPIPGMYRKLSLDAHRGGYRFPLPFNSNILQIPSGVLDLLNDSDINTECVLKPDTQYKGNWYSIHTCDFHEYIIIKWIP